MQGHAVMTARAPSVQRGDGTATEAIRDAQEHQGGVRAATRVGDVATADS